MHPIFTPSPDDEAAPGPRYIVPVLCQHLFRLVLMLLVLQLPVAAFAQSKNIIPIIECVKYTGNGKYLATFGYDNPNKKGISVEESNSYLVYEGNQPNGKPVSSFKIGRQSNVFSIEFDGSKVTWTIKLPNGNIVYVDASLNASLCQPSTDFSFRNYPMPAGGKVNNKIGAELPALFQVGSSGTSDEIFQLESEYVLIEMYAYEGMASQLLADVLELGLKDDYSISTFNPLQITGWFPVASLEALNLLPTLHFAETVLSPIGNVGLTTSRGDVAQRSDLARLGFDVDGSGNKIGVISDSYNTKGGAAADVDNGDLPGNASSAYNQPVQVLGDYPRVLSDEGRAML